MDTIKVPDVPGPVVQLCYKTSVPTAPPFTHALEFCDRRAGHGGRHTWEMARELERLTELLVDAGVSIK